MNGRIDPEGGGGGCNVGVGTGVGTGVGGGVGIGVGGGVGTGVAVGVEVGVEAGVGVGPPASVAVTVGGGSVNVGDGETVGVGVGVGVAAGTTKPAANSAALMPPIPPSVGRTIQGRLAGASCQMRAQTADGVGGSARPGSRSTNGSMRGNATLGYGLNAGGGALDTAPVNPGASVA